MLKIFSVKVIVLLLFTSVWTPVFAETIKLVAMEYPPYYGDNLPNQGFITEIVVEAFKKAGYTVEISFFPRADALEKAKSDYDGIVGVWYSKELEKNFVFSEALPANEIGFYKRKSDQIAFTTFDDLKPYIIGTVAGYASLPEFEKATFLNTTKVEKDSHNIAMLLQDRVDLIIIDKALCQYLLKTEFRAEMNQLEWMSPPLKTDSQYLGIAKKTQGFQKKLNAFNLGLKKITKENMIMKIMEKHGF
ncbi:MAG: transporter substrate-binding domain-containing protein [SAR324 cluster bacterium]|nr:transporter substrate-binding domain-containing protein [SAR324 cluster bacterium]